MDDLAPTWWTAPEGLGYFDLELRCRGVNPALARLWGLEAGAAPGALLGELCPPLALAAGRVAGTGRPEVAALSGSDGLPWTVSLSVVPASPGEGEALRLRVLAVQSAWGARAAHADELLGIGPPLVEVDREWRIVRVTRRVEDVTGRRTAEALGRVLWDVWPELASAATRFGRELGRCMAERVPVAFDDYYAPLGMWASVAAYPIQGGGIAILFQDVSARKSAEEAVAEQAAAAELILASVAEGILVYDTEGRIVRSNAAADALLGYERRWHEQPIARRLATAGIDWLSEEGRPLAPEETPFFRAARLGASHRGVVIRMRRGDVERWLTVSTAPLRVGEKHVGAVASLSDVTERKQIVDALRDSEARYRALFEHLPDAILLTAPDGTIVAANPAACAMFGRTEEEIVAGGHAALVEAGDPRQAALGERSGLTPLSNRELTFVRKGGERFVGETTSVILGGGELSAFLVVRDVTERSREHEALRSSEEKFAKAFQGNAAGMAVTGLRDGVFRDVNDTYVAMSGFARGELVGQSASRVWRHDDERRALVRGLRAEGRVQNLACHMVRKSGEEWTGLLSAQVILIDGEQAVISSVLDITELKKAEEALREADRRKNEFLGVLSHELRNPLAPIRNGVFVLEKVGGDSPQAARAREVIHRQTEHLTRLVDDLLDVTRISRGKIQLQRETVDARGIVRKAAEDLRATFEDAEIDLRIELPGAPLWAHVDPTRLAQVLGNLLQNACKFTPPGGAVTVSARAEGARALIEVRDTGVGIEPEHVPRMFEAFVQEDRSLARTRGGLGLGLALAKGLVELQGGRIRARSDGPGKGSAFTVELPLAPRKAAAPGAARAPAARAARRRVLVIEDNPDAARSLADVLEVLGHEVTIAFNGARGIALARELRPDAVVTDIGLPDVDGYEVARVLRHDEALRAVRLVAVSGYAQPEDVAKAMAAGFDGHVAKPPDPERLAGLLG